MKINIKNEGKVREAIEETEKRTRANWFDFRRNSR